MTLEQATSCHNDLIILDADEPYYRRAFEDVVDALLGVSDRVESAEPGVAYARIDGSGGSVRRRGGSRGGAACRRSRLAAMRASA